MEVPSNNCRQQAKQIPKCSNFVQTITVLLLMSKMLERLLLARILVDNEMDSILLAHQFGFRKTHSTVQQCHRIAKIINESLEKTTFSDFEQSLDRVW